jgi:hypothetical protein
VRRHSTTQIAATIAGGDCAEAPALGVAGAKLHRDGRTAVER